MKILFFVRRFWPEIGGVEKHVFELSKELVKKGHNVTVCTENHGLPESEVHEGVYIVRISVGGDDWFKKFRIWTKLWKLRKVIEKADIVHCHDVFFWYLPFRFLYPSKKIYTTFHGYETIYPPRLQAKIIRKISEKLSKGNICIGAFIQKWYGTKPTFVSYGGVSHAPVEKKQKSSHKNFKIVFLGRVEKDTGFLFYKDIIDRLHKEKINISFIILGEGSLKKSAFKMGTFKGFVPNVSHYLQNADIVFTSSYLSIIESLFYKKNVFSYFDNQLKYDYLSMTPFSQYIHIVDESSHLLEDIKELIQRGKVAENKPGYLWAKKQSWQNVYLTYKKLWNI